jgi:hypothetical protein
MKNRLGFTVLGLVVIAAALQVFPGEHPGNPPVEEEIAAPPEVMTVMRRACFDCHSHETAWPWYSRVAPASWLVRRDVREGRRHLNFSAWNRYDPERRARKLEELGEEVEKGNMPMKIYLPLHAEAKLTDAERTLLVDWAEQAMREVAPAETAPLAGD